MDNPKYYAFTPKSRYFNTPNNILFILKTSNQEFIDWRVKRPLENNKRT